MNCINCSNFHLYENFTFIFILFFRRQTNKEIPSPIIAVLKKSIFILPFNLKKNTANPIRFRFDRLHLDNPVRSQTRSLFVLRVGQMTIYRFKNSISIVSRGVGGEEVKSGEANRMHRAQHIASVGSFIYCG